MRAFSVQASIMPNYRTRIATRASGWLVGHPLALIIALKGRNEFILCVCDMKSMFVHCGGVTSVSIICWWGFNTDSLALAGSSSASKFERPEMLGADSVNFKAISLGVIQRTQSIVLGFSVIKARCNHALISRSTHIPIDLPFRFGARRWTKCLLNHGRICSRTQRAEFIYDVQIVIRWPIFLDCSFSPTFEYLIIFHHCAFHNNIERQWLAFGNKYTSA